MRWVLFVDGGAEYYARSFTHARVAPEEALVVDHNPLCLQ